MEKARLRRWIRDNTLVLMAAGTPLLALACSGAGAGEGPDGPPLATPPTIRDSAGVTIVENAEPQWGPGSEWEVGRLLTSIGETQGEAAFELFRAVDATRLSDGTVAVGNSSSGEIRFFAPDGTFIRTVGSKGGGPGEFRGANAIRALRRVDGDTLLAWDIYGQLVSEFAPDGTFVRSFSLEGPVGQHFFAGVLEDRSLLMYIFNFPPRERGEPLEEGVFRTPMTALHYGVDHRLIGSIPGIPETEQFRGRWGPWGVVSLEPPFGPVSSIRAGGDRIYVATGDSDEVRVYDPQGDLARIVRRTVPPRPVTPELEQLERERRIREEKGDLEEVRVDPRVMRMIDALPYPQFLPPYRAVEVDSEGNLWAEDFPVPGDTVAHWSVFDPEGTWLGKVALPSDLEVYEIGPDYLLGRTLDELEVERIRVYELIKS